jgi:hypothetical protein
MAFVAVCAVSCELCGPVNLMHQLKTSPKNISLKQSSMQMTENLKELEVIFSKRVFSANVDNA